MSPTRPQPGSASVSPDIYSESIEQQYAMDCPVAGLRALAAALVSSSQGAQTPGHRAICQGATGQTTQNADYAIVRRQALNPGRT